MSFLFEPVESYDPKVQQPIAFEPSITNWNNWNPKVQQPFAEQACPPCNCKENDPLPVRGIPGRVRGSSFTNYAPTKRKTTTKVKGSSFANYAPSKKKLTAKQKKQAAMYGSKEDAGIFPTGGIKPIKEPYLPPPPMQDALGMLYGYDDELGADFLGKKQNLYYGYNSKGDYVACDKGVNRGKCRVIRRAANNSPIKPSKPLSAPIITKAAVNQNVQTTNGGTISIYNKIPVPMTAIIPPFQPTRVSHGWKTTFENLASQLVAGYARNPTTQLAGGQVAPVNLPGGGYAPPPGEAGAPVEYTPEQIAQIEYQRQKSLGNAAGSGIDGALDWFGKNPFVVAGLVGAGILLFMKPPGSKKS